MRAIQRDTMGVRASDAVSVHGAPARQSDLPDELPDELPDNAPDRLPGKMPDNPVERSTEKPQTRNVLEIEHADVVLAEGALCGLEDLAAGRILNEDAIDQVLAAPPTSRPTKTR